MNPREKWYATAIVACVSIGFPASLAPVAIPLFTGIALTNPEAVPILTVAWILFIMTNILLYRLYRFRTDVKAQKGNSGETQV